MRSMFHYHGVDEHLFMPGSGFGVYVAALEHHLRASDRAARSLSRASSPVARIALTISRNGSWLPPAVREPAAQGSLATASTTRLEPLVNEAPALRSVNDAVGRAEFPPSA